MPTGYTSEIYDGKNVSFKDFALGCARAFGALISMREEPSDAKIPDEFKPSDHHDKELKKAIKELEIIKSLTDKQVGERALNEHINAVKEYDKYLEENSKLKARYTNMLEQVRAWKAPSSEHNDFKKFMIEQLQSSIEHDCRYNREIPRLQSVSEWRRTAIDSAQWSVDYHREEKTKEIERCAGRTKWIRDLKESLK